MVTLTWQFLNITIDVFLALVYPTVCTWVIYTNDKHLEQNEPRVSKKSPGFIGKFGEYENIGFLGI